MAGLLVGAVACKTEPAKESGTEVTGQPEQEQTLAPEVQETIDSVKENVAEESAERTATITLKDNGITVNGAGCKVEENCLKIKEAGVYEISGSLSNGSICVNAEKDSEVQLILNGVTVHNENGAALFCKKASKVTVTLAKGSENTLTDGVYYVFEEGEDEPDATLFSKQDLIINGEGKLIVTASYGDAVKGKDSLYILGGTMVVAGVEDGIIGKDLLYIGGGDVSVNVVADALKSTNDTDETLGNIVVEDGMLFLMAGEDGVQAEGSVSFNGGKATISAGDDGVHAEKSIQIEDGTTLTIAESIEGLEALEVVVNGGLIEVTAEDDGINAAGGDSTEEFRPGQGMFEAGEGDIIINGGTLKVNAGGDGIDANGNITMNGGTFLLFGPTGGGNGVLDYGGSFLINGGTLLAMGSADMAQTPSDASTQYSLTVVPETSVSAGSTLEILAGDQVVLSERTEKRVGYIVVSSPMFGEGITVTVKVNEEIICEETLNGTVTGVGKSFGKGGFGGFGGGMMQRPDRGEGGGMMQPPEWGNGEMPTMPGNGRMEKPDLQKEAPVA